MAQVATRIAGSKIFPESATVDPELILHLTTPQQLAYKLSTFMVNRL